MSPTACSLLVLIPPQIAYWLACYPLGVFTGFVRVIRIVVSLSALQTSSSRGYNYERPRPRAHLCSTSCERLERSSQSLARECITLLPLCGIDIGTFQ